MHEAFQELSRDFQQLQDTIIVTLDGGGSRTGLLGIFNNEINIGLSSFPFDLNTLFGDNHGIHEKVVAYDGIVLINNPSNPVQQLTHEQIAGIYSGKYTDWSQIGGNQGLILPVIRDENSGTQKFFSEYYKIGHYSSQAIVASENEEIVSSIKENDNGIGFIGLSYFALGVNDIQLESSVTNSFVHPSLATVGMGSYPLKRALRIYYRSTDDPATKAFLIYLESPRAQSIMEDFGLIKADQSTRPSQLASSNL